jgi:hypothetical protein
MYEPVAKTHDKSANCATEQQAAGASGADPAPPIVVTLGHGTFAKGATWTKDGSVLRQEIAAELGRLEHEVTFDVFEWSGRNTHKARVKAGYELADHIRTLRKRFAQGVHFIVAHSHGGNVAVLAHKHLPLELHALGVATLGTPFLYANLPDDLVSATEASLRVDNKESVLFGTLGWMLAGILGVMTASLLYAYLKDWSDWSWLVAIAAGWGAWSLLIAPLTAGLAWMFYPISPRRAAMKLGQALALKPMPRTHLLSFIYQGDEAGALLNTLEKTTSLPSKAVIWFKEIGAIVATIAFLIFIATAFFSEPLGWVFGVGEERPKALAVNTMLYVAMTGFGIWFALVSVRYVLSLLRGHPLGFGWERPSMHAHVDIGVTPRATVPGAKSNMHEEIPFPPAEDAVRGLRHSRLYEDRHILKALAHWIAHVK